MRKFIFLFLLCSLGFGSWYAWNHSSLPNQVAHKCFASSELKTLEIRYSAEELMQAHKNELLKNPSYSFLEPKLLFYPCLLMDVKYSKGRNSTGEGVLLWDLSDAEMVIHAANWEKTHGFEDCLVAKVSKNDFKIIELLAENGGVVDCEKFYNLLNVEQNEIDKWIDSCREKKLIVISGNKFRLHFQNPRLQTEPATSFDQPLVSLTAKKVHKIKGQYSIAQITNFSQTAFGSNFAIRKTQEIFLPVHEISVQNPDNTILRTYWNAVNGKQLNRIPRPF